jgi:pimeloyl-ACP methyl ester carboxylesterase
MKKMIWFFLMVIMPTNCVFSQTSVPLWKTLPEVPPMPKADQSGLATVNNVNLYYGIFNKKGKEPVILLHGAFVTSDIWGFEVPLLMKTHEVIVVDSRGHGRSSMPELPFTYDLMAADVLQLMDELKIKKASIVGWSDGGIIGMILAIRHPERINKLFTFGANYNLSGYKTEAPDSALSAKFMTRAQQDYRRLSPTPGNFTGLKKALGKMYDTEPDLKPAQIKTIRSPTVIAYGEYEQFIKADHFQELARLIPGAKLVIIPNVGHGGPLQDPVHFHHAVIGLLNGYKIAGTYDNRHRLR